jgi:hypothetical protein
MRILLLSILHCSLASAQIDTTLKQFYPLHLGDLWQYRDQSNQLVKQEVIGDTMINGQKYFLLIHSLYSSGGGITRIDSSLRIQNLAPWAGDSCGGLTNESNIYRLNEPPGSVWRICDNVYGASCYPLFMKFDGISTSFVFGQSRQVMFFSPGAYCSDTTWFLSQWTLVRGIGVLHEEKFEGDFLTLSGAIVNGVQYGTIVSVDDAQIEPLTFSLGQNYPNPFNPITKIDYSLPEVVKVSLKIYDVLGQEVKTLVDETQGAGFRSTSFDANTIASGIYFYRLIAGNFTDIKKMILLK